MSALQPDDTPVQPDDAPVWREDERVVRTLALNQQKDLADCLDLVAKIVENIAASPEEHKYRSLRAASKALSTRILARPGGRGDVARRRRPFHARLVDDRADAVEQRG